MRIEIKYIVSLSLSLIALILGSILYIGWRQEVPDFIFRLKDFGFGSIINSIRTATEDSNFNMPVWVVYSLPQGLWSFAFAVMISSIWSNSRWVVAGVWYAFALLLPIGWEISQYFRVLTCTFWWIDLFIGLTGALLGIIIVHFKIIKLWKITC